MGWIKKIVEPVVDVGRIVAPVPAVIVDVASGKNIKDSVVDTAMAPVRVPVDAGATVAAAVAAVDNKITQLQAALIEKVGGEKAKSLFLDIRRVILLLAPAADTQMLNQLIDSAQQFVNTLDPAFLNPFVGALAAEIQRARDSFWDSAKPIPDDVVKAMPSELADLARKGRHILVAEANALSLPAFAIKHLQRARAVTTIDLIFFQEIPGSITDDDLFYWAHEITHMRQYRDMSLIRFAEKYFHEEWKRIGDESEYINSLEVEADLNACQYFPQGQPHYINSCPGNVVSETRDIVDSSYLAYDRLSKGGLMWSDWERHKGVITSDLAVVSWAPNRLDIFAKNKSNQLVHKWYDGQTGSDWEPHDGTLNSSPAVSSWGWDRLDVFAANNANELVHKWYDGRTWSDWESHDGVITSNPAVISLASERLAILALNDDYELVHKWYDGRTWSDWEPHYGTLNSNPAVSSWGQNRLDVFVRSSDNELVHKWWGGQGWSDWQRHDGVITSDPAVVSWAPNRLDVFAKDNNWELLHKWWDGQGWSGWERHDGVITSRPAVISLTPTCLEVFAKNKSDELIHKWYDGRTWSGWERHKGLITYNQTVVSWDRNRLDVFAIGNEENLYHMWGERRP